MLDNVADGLLYAGVQVHERRELAAQALGAVGLADRAGRSTDDYVRRSAPAHRDRPRPRRPARDRTRRRADRNLDSHTGESILELLEELNTKGRHNHRDHSRPRPRNAPAPAGSCAGRADRHRHQPVTSSPPPVTAGRRISDERKRPTDPRAPAPSGDMARVASVGLRTRRLRAALSALGIAIGVAAIVAVLGLSSSSQAGLLAEIDRLGTNLLTVTNGQTFTGEAATLPLAAPGDDRTDRACHQRR